MGDRFARGWYAPSVVHSAWPGGSFLHVLQGDACATSRPFVSHGRPPATSLRSELGHDFYRFVCDCGHWNEIALPWAGTIGASGCTRCGKVKHFDPPVSRFAEKERAHG